MAKHIHIHVHTRDADGPAHAPAGSSKGGQFVSGGGSGGGKVNRPQHSPMRQENRNLEAKQLKESKKIAKAPVSPGVNPGVRQMQAKADVEEAKKRIAARKKKEAQSPKSDQDLQAQLEKKNSRASLSSSDPSQNDEHKYFER